MSICYISVINICLIYIIMEYSRELGDETLWNSLLRWMVGYHYEVGDFLFIQLC